MYTGTLGISGTLGILYIYSLQVTPVVNEQTMKNQNEQQNNLKNF
jgi:hypothetical protein